MIDAWRISRRMLGLCAAAVLVGCGGDDSSGPEGDDGTQEFLVGVRLVSADVQATFVAGEAPAAGSGPSAQVTLSGVLIPGGSQLATITSTSSFDEVYVTLAGQSGYYRLNLPASVLSVAIAVIVDEEPPSGTFQIRIAAGSGGSVGNYQSIPVTLTQVGTGEVQVSVAWDALSDVDLHVVDPAGEEIYYAHRTSASAGELDLDANAGCGIDNPLINAENITWADAPRGTYIVRLDYWSACDVAATNYVVTLRVQGQATRTFRGTFTGTGNHGGEGDGIEITRFTY